MPPVLAHELNNPAAALVRTLREMPAAILELQRMNLVYGQRNVEEAHTQQWLKTRDQGYDAILNERLDPVITKRSRSHLAGLVGRVWCEASMEISGTFSRRWH